MQENIRQNLLPALLSSSIVCTVLSIFTAWIPLAALFIAAISLVVFRLCDAVQEKAERAVVYLLLLVGLAIGSYLTSVGPGLYNFLSVLFSSQLSARDFIALTLLCSVIIGLAVYYFTRVRYRMYALLLLIFMPCMLYAARYQLVPVVYIALNVILYFILLIDVRRPPGVYNSRYRASLIEAAAALLILIVVIPKSTATPYSIFTPNFGNRAFGPSSSADLEVQDEQNSDQVILKVKADQPLYLDSHVYGRFEGTRWSRLKHSELETGYDDWQEKQQMTADLLLALIRQASKTDASFGEYYGLDPAFLPDTKADSSSAVIEHVEFPARTILHPVHTNTVTGYFSSVYQNSYDELFLDSGQPVMRNASYQVVYQTATAEAAKWMQTFFKGYSDEDYQQFLVSMQDVFDNDGAVREYLQVQNILEEFSVVQEYSQASRSSADPEISRLARSLTEGLTTDYEKAAAITDYFHQGDFTYSLDYEGPKEYNGDINYFLTQSKTGRCSYFASAMTLIARESGLHVRYVEGFYTGNEKEEEAYQVTMQNFHAYPQVYLYGQGWTVFEPTASYIGGGTASSFLEGFENYEIMTIALCILGLLCLVGFGIYQYWLPLAREWHFCRRMKRCHPGEGIPQLYRRLKEQVERKNKASCGTVTAQMLCHYFMKEYRIDITYFSDAAEKAMYSSQSVGQPEYLKVYKEYKAAGKAMRKDRKKRSIEQQILQEQGV